VTAPVRYSPAGWFAGEAEHLISDAGDKDRYAGAADRQADALRGIGYALLAIAERLGDGNDESAGIAAHLEQLAMTAGDLAAPAPRRGRWPWRRRPGPVTADIAAGRLPAVPMSGEDVLSALAGIWSGGGWARLEICRPAADGGYAGYCVPVTGPRVLTAGALADPASCPDSITGLAALLSASGWQRLQIIGYPAHGRPYGWCEPADGTVISLAGVLECAVSVPDITVPRYTAPPVSATRVRQVISPEPAGGRHRPGHYQQVLLNTRTGELSFNECTEHLEPRDPPRAAVNDVPRQMWKRWHPGELFLPWGGPHMWFEPVPELLAWVIDSGTPSFPYLDADAASALLEELAPYAQALLNWLFDAGELDWSAASVRAGRDITRLCSRDRLAGGCDKGLADYADIVRQLPQVYEPDLLKLPLDKLASECEYITRFLGCSEHWHPEVKEAFGAPYSDGSGVALDVLGVRAWYRTAAGLAAGDGGQL
jgi:hypothetical protein